MTETIEKAPQKSKARAFRSKKYWIKQLVGLTLLYVLLSPMCGILVYNKLLFFPWKDVPDVNDALEQIASVTGAQKQDLNFVAPDGKRLAAWYFKLPGAKKVFLYSHGNGGNIAHRIIIAATLLKCQGSVFLYDYEGYGNSEGEPSIDNIRQDGLAAYDYVHTQLKYDAKDIIAYGESLGSGVTINIAQKRPVAGIILQSGFSSLRSAAESRLPWLRLYPDFMFANMDMNNAAYAHGKHPPMLLLHGDNDAILPIVNAYTMEKAASPPFKLVVIKGAGHNDTYTTDAKLFARSVNEFVSALP